MDSDSKPIIFASKDRIWLMGENPAYGWNEGNIEEILLEIKSKIGGKPVRILLDDSVSYFASVPTDDALVTPSEALSAIQSQIPEKIENGFWDYKVNKHTGVNHIQAFVIKRSFLEPFSQGLLSADLVVEASEPVSLSLARLTAIEQSPHVIVYSLGEEGYSLILADLGEVLSVVHIENVVSEEEIKKFIKFCDKYYHIIPSKTILRSNLFIDLHEISGVPMAHVDLDPFKGIAKKKDIKGEDTKVLNLDSQKLLKPLVLPEDMQGEEVPKKRKKKLKIVGLMLIVAIIAFGGYLAFSGQLMSESEPQATPAPTLAPTPEPLDLNSYKIQILNGTGEEGEAGYVKGLLGLEEAEIKNASNYDYEFTEVSLKENLPQDLYNKIEEKLSGEYKVSRSAKSLTSDSDFDVVIITGVKN